MNEPGGLRERKRERTHQAISAAAITLFLDRGFDQVSVADIAAAAEVSKPTLFKYFASKEELALHRIADHREEAATVVRQRATGQGPLAALHRHFLDGLRDRDPVTGLNDHPRVLAYHRMIFATPSLRAARLQYTEHDEQALAEALDEYRGAAGPSGITAGLAAGQLIAVQRVLARENWRRLVDGRSADQQYDDAVAAADHAFDLLRRAYGEYYG
ncbi:TetR/AcrR family transcriptional regulator [Micromonospora sp. NBC_01796]|uniref:TetR/AcrR family transcriptional regulator n=1 Tax=Micromonospora sp. NBC_01796 TaxID=2975987 RepID=UPI002DD9A77F|nr:helix-turn-helix domain-containing protein [Micromonospora sp. NBC_01796]WSA87891.1 TetR/AcrR family transcriptional regulator [Micromonospora sp. NBC_01796]